MSWLDLAWAVMSLPVLVPAGYLFVLALLSARCAPPSPTTAVPFFDVVVPAHNEEAGIARTVQNLLTLQWARDRFRVLVVADNCTDATAERARAAGATVLERSNSLLKGKGYALAHAFEVSLRERRAQAVVVVDADTVVSPNLLSAFAARLERGANAMQAHYGVLAPEASWRTRLMQVAFALFHGVRSNARERMRVSCGLRGNGMCFTTRVLAEVPHDAFSVVEDLEYGIRLGRAGHRVWYVGEALVQGEMVSGEKASRSQRKRWEGGRRLIARQHGWPLLRDAIVRRSGLLLDLALDVLVPPLSWVVASAVGGALAALGLRWLLGPETISIVPWSAAVVCVVVYVARGWQVSGSGVAGLLALARAPVYVAWKLWLALAPGSKRDKEWVRTTREGREQPEDAGGDR